MGQQHERANWWRVFGPVRKQAIHPVDDPTCIIEVVGLERDENQIGHLLVERGFPLGACGIVGHVDFEPVDLGALVLDLDPLSVLCMKRTTHGAPLNQRAQQRGASASPQPHRGDPRRASMEEQGLEPFQIAPHGGYQGHPVQHADELIEGYLFAATVHRPIHSPRPLSAQVESC